MGLNEKLRRAVVPAAVVAGVAAAGAGLYPAIASDRGPDLPDVTPHEVIVMMAGSDTEQLSGTVRVDAGPALAEFSRFADGLDGPAGALADLASGTSTLRIAVDGPERQRLVISEGAEEFTLIHNQGTVWAYDGASNTVFRGTAPEGAELPGADDSARLGGLTPQEAAERLLEGVEDHAEFTVEGTGRVAGQSVYRLLVEPAEPEGMVDLFRISVDAETGIPLAVTLEGDERTLVDVAFSRIDYEQPSGGSFEFTPPQGATVVDLDSGEGLAGFLPDFLELLPDHN
ncbi:hypothetical protein GCM10009716_26820 [Streptomyces sodiiphilus]|uniref:DUF2092 domain-containing protein n=2 Tax=Streptomyces sodiiphilus TaxID=226217 RepID=A0ABN2PDK1_9ACTN